MDMYDRIQRQPARRQHYRRVRPFWRPLGFWWRQPASACWCMRHGIYLRYRRFINDFSASLAASNKMSLRMTWQDKDVPITTVRPAACAAASRRPGGEVQRTSPRWRRMPTRFWRWRFADHVAVDISEKMRPTLLALLSAMPMLTGWLSI